MGNVYGAGCTWNALKVHFRALEFITATGMFYNRDGVPFNGGALLLLVLFFNIMHFPVTTNTVVASNATWKRIAFTNQLDLSLIIVTFKKLQKEIRGSKILIWNLGSTKFSAFPLTSSSSFSFIFLFYFPLASTSTKNLKSLEIYTRQNQLDLHVSKA